MTNELDIFGPGQPFSIKRQANGRLLHLTQYDRQGELERWCVVLPEKFNQIVRASKDRRALFINLWRFIREAKPGGEC